VHLVVGHETFEVVDIDRFFNQVAVALVLAEMRADPPDGQRHGHPFPDEPEGLQIPALGNEGYVALDVETGGTGELTGRHAVAVVFPEKELDDELARFQDLRRVRGDHHALSDLGAARGLEVRLALHSHHTEPAALQGPEDLAVAEGGDLDVILPGRLENGGSRLGLHPSTVNGQLDFLHHGYPLFSRGHKRRERVAAGAAVVRDLSRSAREPGRRRSSYHRSHPESLTL
jgi:hypothetical protein